MDAPLATSANLTSAALLKLAQDTDAHLNAPLDVAHGISYIEAQYSDSLLNVLSDTVIVWNIGGINYYSPAVSAPSFSGSSNEEGKLNQIFNSLTIDKTNLVTTNDPRYGESLAAIAATLAAHAAKGYTNAHQTVSVITEDHFNLRGFLVGRYSIQLSYGGSTVKLLADTIKTGPPKAPQVLVQPVSTTSHAGGGDPQPPAGFTVKGSGSTPVTITWQSFNASNGWTDIVSIKSDGTGVVVHNGAVSSWNNPGHWTAFYSSTSAVPEGAYPVVSSLVLAISSTGENTTYDAFRIRARFTNDFGVSFSSYASINCIDETGCWICTQINEVQRLTTDERALLKQFRRYCVKTHGKIAWFYLSGCRELTKRMTAARVDWKLFVGFDQSVLHLIRAHQLEAAYVLYRETVLAEMAKHWPDCNHPSYLTALAQSKAACA